MKTSLPGALWLALFSGFILALNEALQALDMSNAPQLATIAVLFISVLAKAVQEEARERQKKDDDDDVVHVMGQRKRSFLERFLFG